MKLHPDLRCPRGLSANGRIARAVILQLLKDNGLNETGGCRAFYSPKEWTQRGEEYGKNSELIVVYDGGDVRELFEPEFCYKLPDALYEALKSKRLWYEPCTCWYSAIYTQ